jgi:hypothetical protein
MDNLEFANCAPLGKLKFQGLYTRLSSVALAFRFKLVHRFRLGGKSGPVWIGISGPLYSGMPGPVCSGTGGPLCSGIGGRIPPESALQGGDTLQLELNRLRKENKRLKMEREILKKAAVFFAKETS